MIKQDNEWRYHEDRVRVEGDWKEFIRTYQKVDGEWKLVNDMWTWSLFALQWESDNFWEGIDRNDL